jgi:hypothetical protein
MSTRARREVLMQWVIGLFLVVLLGHVQAQERSDPTQELEKEYAERTYEQVIVKFNTDIQDFASWQAFKTEVLARVSPGTLGRCYERTTSPMQPVQITRVSLQRVEEEGWEETSGHGWRRHDKADKTFIEYRFNVKAGILLRAESVKTWFFPPQTRKMCEFPL